MIERTLARRYAAAMLAVAEREGTVEEVERSLLALKDAWKGNPMFRRALKHPKIPRARRRQLLRAPFEGRTRASFLEFLDLLVDKNRVDLIPLVADSFDALADASHGIVRVAVRTAFPLSEAQRGALHERLGRITGRKVEMQEQVEPGLKGGVAVRIGDTVIDGTLSNRLKVLRERLLGTRA